MLITIVTTAAYIILYAVSLGAGRDAPIITPLMDFVRQKRAAKSGSRVFSFPNILMKVSVFF